MSFLRRNQYLLLFVAVLTFSCVMVVRQYLINQSAHVQMLEDFLMLCEREEVKPSEKLYQLLIQQLPELNDKSLVDHLARTGMLVDPKTPNPASLVWKYHVSVKNELARRSNQRLARALKRAESEK
jgi:hypothetical protein